MSGIAGLFSDAPGRRVEAARAAGLAARLSRRGTGAAALWHGGRIVLAHAHRGPAGAACRALDEPAPVDAATSEPATGGPELRLVGDVRLDERDALARALGLFGRPSEAALILAAYRRWGADLCEHLVGDFAFALWDAAEQRLLCARDRFGVKPLAWTNEDGVFAFASEPAILAGGPARPSIERFAPFLAEIGEDASETLHPGVRRLPAGHVLLRGDGRTTIRRYWQLVPGEPVTGATAEAGFRQRFEAGVERRLDGADAPGLMLSGGLDSSSIAVLAVKGRPAGARPLPSFTFVYPRTPDFDERRFAEAVLARGRFAPTFLAADDHPPLLDVEAAMAEQGGPFAAPGLTKMRRLYRAAATAGVATLLDGHGGDEIVWHGGGRLRELAHDGAWGRLALLAAAQARAMRDDPLRLLLVLFYRHGPDHPLGRALRRAAGRVGRRIDARGAMPAYRSFADYLSEPFKRRTGIVERAATARGADAAAAGARPDDRAEHLAALTSAAAQGALEVLDRAAAAAGVEPRYPFLDADLARFCVGLPSSEKMRNGWPRSVLRRALAGDLPEAVAWRRDKIDFGREVARGLVRHHGAVLDDMAADPQGMVSDIYDMPALREGIARLRRAPDAVPGPEIRFLWRAAALHLWQRGTEGGADALAASSAARAAAPAPEGVPA